MDAIHQLDIDDTGAKPITLDPSMVGGGLSQADGGVLSVAVGSWELVEEKSGDVGNSSNGSWPWKYKIYVNKVLKLGIMFFAGTCAYTNGGGYNGLLSQQTSLKLKQASVSNVLLDASYDTIPIYGALQIGTGGKLVSYFSNSGRGAALKVSSGTDKFVPVFLLLLE